MADKIKSPFVHLHVHTEGSVLDGACQVSSLMQRAAELGQEAVGITDHGSMTQLLKAQKAGDKAGVKVVHGCELYFIEDRTARDPKNRYYHLTVLAENNTGYQNLCRLTSHAQREGWYYKPRADYELLKKYSEGLIVLTGCMASRTMQELMAEGKDLSDKARMSAAREEILRMTECVGRENVYVELQNNEVATEFGNQRQWNEELYRVAKDLSLPSVATGDVHYLRAEDADPHDTLLCVQTKSLKSKPYSERMSLLPQKYYLRSYQEMQRLLDNVPGAVEASVEVADRCNARIETGRTFELLPTFPVPEDFVPAGEQPEGMEDHVWRGQSYLRHLAWEGLHRRYGDPVPAEMAERAEFELGVVNDMGVTDYFLIVWDLVRAANERGLVVGPGRGSGAGSILLYALNVTQLCPIENDLLFERFLNPDRVSMPDVDLDCFDWDPVREYMIEKYGQEHCAQIITFGKIGSKSGIKRAAQAMGPEYFDLANRMSKAVPMNGQVPVALDEALETGVELKQIIAGSRDAQKIIEYAKWMEGMLQNESVHAAAFVVSPVPVDEVVPVQVSDAGKGVELTAFDMKDAEDVGLLKLDFLGLRNLGVISETERLVEKRTGEKIDVWQVPRDDAKTYEMMAGGDSIGVFQFESSGMQESLKLVGADCFEDLIAIVALYRPGPMANIPVYARRKKGQEPVTYDDDRLKEILDVTMGVIVYQEQSMRISRDLAGFTRGEADTLRKAIGKKNKELMAQLKPKFVAGCKANKVPGKVAEALWESNEASAEYSFNRSHAACYALISYVTAYLKANYPVEYMAALLTSVIDKKDKVPFYLYETKRMGIKVLPPDVNASFSDFEPDGGQAIRFGLTAIKGIGHQAVETIVAERERNGEFKSLWDFCQRVAGSNKKEVEALIKAGAFDSTGATRKGLLDAAPDALKQAKNIRVKKDAGQDSLFDAMGSAEDAFGAIDLMSAPQISTEEFTQQELFALEREVAGLYVSGHPLDSVHREWARTREIGIGQVTPGHITDRKDKGHTVVGIITGRQTFYTKRDGKKMYKLVFEDLTGSEEVMVFSRALEQNPDLERITEPGEHMVWMRLKVEEDTRGFGKGQSDEGDEDGDESAVALSFSTELIKPWDPGTVQVEEYFEVKVPREVLLDATSRARILASLREVAAQHPGPQPMALSSTKADGSPWQHPLKLSVETSTQLKAAVQAIAAG